MVLADGPVVLVVAGTVVVLVVSEAPVVVLVVVGSVVEVVLVVGAEVLGGVAWAFGRATGAAS